MTSGIYNCEVFARKMKYDDRMRLFDKILHITIWFIYLDNYL